MSQTSTSASHLFHTLDLPQKSWLAFDVPTGNVCGAMDRLMAWITDVFTRSGSPPVRPGPDRTHPARRQPDGLKRSTCPQPGMCSSSPYNYTTTSNWRAGGDGNRPKACRDDGVPGHGRHPRYGLPVFAFGSVPSSPKTAGNRPAQCPAAAWRSTGDVIVGDEDGVVVTLGRCPAV
jgi:hypothetical protein